MRFFQFLVGCAFVALTSFASMQLGKDTPLFFYIVGGVGLSIVCTKMNAPPKKLISGKLMVGSRDFETIAGMLEENDIDYEDREDANEIQVVISNGVGEHEIIFKFDNNGSLNQLVLVDVNADEDKEDSGAEGVNG